MSWVGRPLARREDERFLTGRARYLDDLQLEGALHAAFARSLVAHARLGAVDVTAARALPGVVAVLTAADLGTVHPPPVVEPPGMWVADAPHPILAGDTVRYAGEPIALVVAESRALAEDAAELVEVDYEPLDADVDARLAAEALTRWERSAGDVEDAFARADRVVGRHFSLPRLVAAPMEPRGALGAYDAKRDLLTVWLSFQDPHRPLDQLAHCLGRPPESIRVVLPDVGGAFGSKGAVGPEVVAVAAAALALDRPVKWAEDRLENFLSAYQGRGLEADVELAVTGEGRLLGVRARLHADLGAYLITTTAIPMHTTAMLITGAYDIPAAEVTIVGARTHKVPTGPYRGAGRPEAAYLIERMVDEAARELGLDPLDLRRRNLVRAFPHETPFGWTYDSGDFARCLDLAVELAELDLHRAARKKEPGRRLGIGVGMLIERSAGSWESAVVRRELDGRVLVRTGSSPHGQGHETTFAQIAADELGVDPDRVEVRWGDSEAGPAGVGTFGSRSTAMGGAALLEALHRLQEEGGDEAEAIFESGYAFSSGAYVAVVEIDPETGALEILRLAAVDDAGRIVNPLLAHGQVVGATAQGVGQALVEAVRHDEAGQPLTISFVDYPLLTASEMPQLRSAFVETPSPLNPLGAKGVGEGGSIATPAAIANAVVDALGGVAIDPPFTAETLWEALQ
jgi:aerobic carbon-monoxide dehydrogenase large subunit